MALAIIGDGTFRDSCVPLKGKTEWGMDSLTRKMTGARSLAEAFIATFAQGQAFQGYNLQTWDSDDNPQVATITLNYKGLLAGGTPTPRSETQIMQASGSGSVSFTTQNNGLGIVYRKKPLYRFSFQGPPDSVFINPVGPEFAIPDAVVAARDVYTTGAQVQFLYSAVQSVYSYISQGRPAAPRYEHVLSTFEPFVIEARGITADGFPFGKDSGVFGLFNIQSIERVIAFNVTEVIGTPYFECQDTIRKELYQPPTP